MKKLSSHIRKLAFVTPVLVALTFNSRAEDSEYSRAGRWEVGSSFKYWMGCDVIESATGVGFMGGYNFNEHWNLSVEGYFGIWLNTEFNGVDGRGSIYTAIVNLDYYLKPGRFSPYLTASAGIFNYDSKEDFHGPSSFSISETGVSYGGGAGVRWEIARHWFMKASYRAFGTTADGVDFMHGPEVTVGFKF